MTLTPGTRLGNFDVLSELGSGGMGEVYKARDVKLGRNVAIKILPPEMASDAQRLLRFEREARAASALNHPNIVTIYEIGDHQGAPYIAMEYVEGKTLREALAEGPLPNDKLARFATQTAEGLTKAHEAGIVHRDLKPENLVISEDGYVKILDFGLAMLARESIVGPEDSTLARATTPGAILGTIGYMSPEQAEGRSLDARSDIFSFGSVLYEMVTARRPFEGDSKLSILTRILSADPTPPTKLAPSTPPELERIILRCLRKDPARRYQTMADVKVDLEDLREALRPPRARRASRFALAVPLALLAVITIWRVSRKTEFAEPLRSVPFTTLAGEELYPSISPDGDLVAFAWNGAKQNNSDIYVQRIGSDGSALQLTTDTASDFNPVWSPDGRVLAFLRLQPGSGTCELRLVPPLGGPERKLAEIRTGEAFVTPPYLAWCPDGKCFVASDSSGAGKPTALFVVSLETGEKTQRTHPEPPASGDAHPAFSPDGSWLVFRRNASALYAGELYRIPLGEGPAAAGEPERLTAAAMDAEHPAWLPGGREILFSAIGGLWRLDAVGDAPGDAMRLPFVGEDGRMPAVSRPGPEEPSRLIYVRSFVDFNIWRVETPAPGAPPSSPLAAAIASTRSDDMPDLSPDGRQVAFASDRSGAWEIWLAGPDGSNALQLTHLNARVTGYPRWSPDGQRIAFHTILEGQPDVYAIPAAGGKARNLTAHPANVAFPSFSRDGAWIYFTSNRSGEDRIWRVPVTGGDAVQVTEAVGYTPAESPDGTHLYYVENVFTPSALMRVPVSGGPASKVLDGVVLGNFVVLDKGIYYIDRPSDSGGLYLNDRPSGDARLEYFQFATKTSTTVASNLGVVDLPLTASADGRTILYSRMDSSVVDLMLVENFR